MKSIRLSPTCIVTMPDAYDQEINVDGRIWRFEYDRHLGPHRLDWVRKDPGRLEIAALLFSTGTTGNYGRDALERADELIAAANK